MTQTSDLMVKLAGMKQPCGSEHGTGKYGLPAPIWCSRCQGTGKVYLLDDSVRVPCQGYTISGQHGSVSYTCPMTGEHPRYEEGRCACASRGWMPSEDFVTWCWALKGVGAHAIRLGLDPVSIVIYWLEEAWENGMPGKLIDAETALTALARR